MHAQVDHGRNGNLLARMAVAVSLTLILPGWTQAGEMVLQSADNAEPARTAIDGDRQAAKDMAVGRYYMSKRDYTSALNRFKVVVTQFPTSAHVEEALEQLTEAFLVLGLDAEAQTAVAVLGRKFPNGYWSAQARDALKSAGLEPAENEQSWISRSLK